MLLYTKGGPAMKRLGYDFYHRDCPEVARDLVGKVLVY